jgi:hypothetical protein
MSGNVYEICEDMLIKERVVSKEDYIEKEGNRHLVKGGISEETAKIGYRHWGDSGQFLSFRLAHNV